MVAPLGLLVGLAVEAGELHRCEVAALRGARAASEMKGGRRRWTLHGQVMLKIQDMESGEVLDLEPVAPAGVWTATRALRDARRSSRGLAFGACSEHVANLHKMPLAEAVQYMRTHAATLFVWDPVARLWCESVYVSGLEPAG